MVKSQRSSTTLFHQCANITHTEKHSPTPATPNHQQGISKSSISTPLRELASWPISYSHHDVNSGVTAIGNRAASAPGLQNNSPTPGSPSQIDPFGSQITSPAPIYPTANHNNNTITTNSVSGSGSSRPPSQVLSAGGSPLPGTGTNSTVVTPKIVLASPSTGTIHYLFPSSDTKNGIHLSTSQSVIHPSLDNITRTTGQGDGKPLKRGQSLSRGNSIKHRNNVNANGSDTLQPHRETPGLKNKRSLPTPTLGQGGDKENSRNQPKKVQAQSLIPHPSAGGVKKSDISKPYPSLSDEARDYSKGYYDVGPDADMMGTLRRQPGMVDLGRKHKVGLRENYEGNIGVVMKRRESIILKEIENRRERRGWEIGSRPSHGNDPIDPTSPRTNTKTSTNITRTGIRAPHQKPYVPPITVIQQRRRSQSLTSPRPAPSPPADPRKSPLLPAPDLGDPLSLSVVIPSPSYSHLDYSPAGSSASSISRSQSRKGTWGKRASMVFPLSVAMQRGDTRKGLGTFDSAKLRAQEDYEQRSNWSMGGRIASIKRSVSLRKKDGVESGPGRKTRPRSQSLTTTKSIRGLDEAPPLPTPSLMKGGYIPYGQEYTSSGYTGELSIDLGSRYHPHHQNGSSTTIEMDLASPRSAETSIFPASTPTTSEYDHSTTTTNNLKGEKVIRIVGRPLHPAFNESDSELSILAPSTVGLGFSPVGTPVSLPGSLLEEAIDLTETGRRISSPMVEAVITPPTPQNHGVLPRPALLDPHSKDTDSPSSTGGQRIPRRSLLLAQNRFYIPSSHLKPSPTPTPDVSKKPSLRSSKSLGQGIMKRAYTSANLKADASHQHTSNINNHTLPSEPSTSTSFGGLLKSASIRSTTRRFSKISENHDTPPQHHEGRHYGTERISSTYSMRFKTRPLTTFSLCSPSDAIEPLPDNSPSRSISMANQRGETKTQPHTLRSNKSSPFLSASNSLRIIFGKDGFVARSLSQAFDKDHQHQPQNRESTSGYSDTRRERSPSPRAKEELKMKISSPLEASNGGTRRRQRALSPEYEEQAREKGRNADKKWRESVLQEALSISISNSSSLNKLGEYEAAVGIGQNTVPRVVSSGSKSRLAIPDQLLSAPNIRDSTVSTHSEGFRGIGESMLNTQNSLESSLNLRAVMMQDWDEGESGRGVGRTLGTVGKEESMISAPSFYSNNASTLFEKPTQTRRLQGKGLPSCFSITELTKRSGSSSKSKVKVKAEDGGNKSNKLGIRQISQPIPISSPLSYNDRIKTFDLTTPQNENEMEQLKEPFNSVRDTQRGKYDGSTNDKNRSLSARSSIFTLRSNSKSPEPVKANSNSKFGLSLKASIRNRSIGKKNGISSSDYNPEVNPTTTSANANSSQTHGVLDDLLARDEVSHSETEVLVDSGTSGGERLRKVLEWRDEVGENEHLARLEQKIRGFVSDERERVRDIGRKSIEG
ncbi:hypothetical protein I302_106269 [Kwoniella bestiolae CBS 10118]|uniref:Uncharacterized protein n=1 Tax=Kwoniella bestiolae CBS 10118 TaxID=1296100 RepID=A0A1B9G3H7_9TREE|nr:hypothetical protein I302_05393 [Kwoniella bestiolae CBS 10118]OCF25573.1 hypothetical protein I302_05393 [Kwoniella bestiolae CBS 10118]